MEQEARAGSDFPQSQRPAILVSSETDPFWSQLENGMHRRSLNLRPKMVLVSNGDQLRSPVSKLETKIIFSLQYLRPKVPLVSSGDQI